MNNGLAGFVTLAVAGLWIAYLMPHKLRHRQQLLESRTDDRFSGALRVLAVTDHPGRIVRMSDSRPRSGATPDCAATADKRVGLLTPGLGVPLAVTRRANGGIAVDRPHGSQDRLSADAARRAAQQRAAHVAAAARRGAAARRRAFLALTLLVASAVGWTATGLTTVTVAAGVVPSVLFAGVILLGRRAVVAGRAADAEWALSRRESALAPARPSPHAPAIIGRAVHPSESHTEVFARILDQVDGGWADALQPSSTGTTSVVRRSTRGDDRTRTDGADDTWSPVPVPRPTYTVKAPAPRREPAPLGELEGSTEVRAATPRSVDDHPRTQTRTPIEAAAATPGSINLDAGLARRRAAGE